jgi:hypothetical protein
MVIAFIYWHIAAPFFRLGVQIFERVEEFLAAKSSDGIQTIGICDNTYVGPHQFSWFLRNALIHDFVVSNSTANNQWDKCISLDFNFCGLSEPRNPKKNQNSPSPLE